MIPTSHFKKAKMVTVQVVTCHDQEMKMLYISNYQNTPTYVLIKLLQTISGVRFSDGFCAGYLERFISSDL